MADYHPLIARAVAGLEKNTGENRRALYERARVALVAQLRGVVPALDESETTRPNLIKRADIPRPTPRTPITPSMLSSPRPISSPEVPPSEEALPLAPPPQ